MRNEIISRLTKMGYKAQAKDCVKNGVVKEGICIQYEGSNVGAVVYLDNFYGKDVETAITGILDAFRNAEESKPAINMDSVLTADNFRKNLVIAIQKVSTEDIVKSSTEYEGIEKYILLKYQGMSATIKVTKQILERAKVSETDAWTWATENTLNDVKTCDLSETIGIPVPSGMHIATNKAMLKGASAILFRCVLEKCAKEYDTSTIWVIPSSIHECLVVPYDMIPSQEDADSMVSEVNAQEVLPEEQLTNRAYKIEL